MTATDRDAELALQREYAELGVQYVPPARRRRKAKGGGGTAVGGVASRS